MRASHPEAVVGGLASSAPIGYYDHANWASHGIDEYTWSDIVTKDYARYPGCLETIEAASHAIDTSDIADVVKAFHACSESTLGPDRPSELFAYALESLPQLDYPYPVGGRPGWPVKYTCDVLTQASNDQALIDLAANVTFMAMGFDAKSGGCMETLPEGPGGIPGDGPGPGAWGWQSCTENLHQFSAKGVRSYNFSMAKVVDTCSRVFNGTATLNTTRLTQVYGGYKLGDGEAGITNVIWSNGGLDPWSGGGFLKPKPDTANHWFFLERGAHHYDLRGPHADDTDEVTAVRALEETIIRGWIEEASREVQ
mmetsp:Transcript_9664/g.18969  ORF Transcript_9664/g.18969 Transcript_9664/m.18969 type:complete len:311 (-) Transcript_9664:188-1120(-)